MPSDVQIHGWKLTKVSTVSVDADSVEGSRTAREPALVCMLGEFHDTDGFDSGLSLLTTA